MQYLHQQLENRTIDQHIGAHLNSGTYTVIYMYVLQYTNVSSLVAMCLFRVVCLLFSSYVVIYIYFYVCSSSPLSVVAVSFESCVASASSEDFHRNHIEGELKKFDTSENERQKTLK